jgi:hypothetical protein
MLIKILPDFKKVPDLLEGLVKNVNDRIDNVEGDDIIKLAAEIHYNFINIHPLVMETAELPVY